MTHKTCTTCGKHKPHEMFYRHRSSKDGFAGRCKPCQKTLDAEYYRTNRDICNARRSAWTAANPDKKKEMKRRWKERNPEKVRAEKARWRERNPGRVHAYKVNRKLAALKRCVLLTPERAAQVAAIYAEAQRLSIETGVPHHVDHIAPLMGKTVSGLHVPENLRIIPASDNLKKGAKVDYDLITESMLAMWF